jgi:hypothetical protein
VDFLNLIFTDVIIFACFPIDFLRKSSTLLFFCDFESSSSFLSVSDNFSPLLFVYCYFPAESRLKHLLSGFRSVRQVFINGLEAERRGEKSTYTGRLSYESNVSLANLNGIE